MMVVSLISFFHRLAVYGTVCQDATDHQINNPSSTHSLTPSSSETNKQQSSPLLKPNLCPSHLIPKRKRKHQLKYLTNPNI
jgi:hypothetical protein